ncbi:MAG: hypothetical protein HRT98_00365 [Mycoplasmatales bacterium]|nr:hypothetical protein [Mycoplasmatales bacterium]
MILISIIFSFKVLESVDTNWFIEISNYNKTGAVASMHPFIKIFPAYKMMLFPYVSSVISDSFYSAIFLKSIITFVVVTLFIVAFLEMEYLSNLISKVIVAIALILIFSLWRNRISQGNWMCGVLLFVIAISLVQVKKHSYILMTIFALQALSATVLIIAPFALVFTFYHSIFIIKKIKIASRNFAFVPLMISCSIYLFSNTIYIIGSDILFAMTLIFLIFMKPKTIDISKFIVYIDWKWLVLSSLLILGAIVITVLSIQYSLSIEKTNINIRRSVYPIKNLIAHPKFTINTIVIFISWILGFVMLMLAIIEKKTRNMTIYTLFTTIMIFCSLIFMVGVFGFPEYVYDRITTMFIFDSPIIILLSLIIISYKIKLNNFKPLILTASFAFAYTGSIGEYVVFSNQMVNLTGFYNINQVHAIQKLELNNKKVYTDLEILKIIKDSPKMTNSKFDNYNSTLSKPNVKNTSMCLVDENTIYKNDDKNAIKNIGNKYDLFILEKTNVYLIEWIKGMKRINTLYEDREVVIYEKKL